MTTAAEKLKAKAASKTTAPAAKAETAAPAPAETAAPAEGASTEKKRVYKTREENIAFWQGKKAKATEEYEAKIKAYDERLAKLLAKGERKRAVVDTAVVETLVETMSEAEIAQKRAEFEAALRKVRAAKAEAGDQAPAEGSTDEAGTEDNEANAEA